MVKVISLLLARNVRNTTFFSTVPSKQKPRRYARGLDMISPIKMNFFALTNGRFSLGLVQSRYKRPSKIILVRRIVRVLVDQIEATGEKTPP